VGTPADDSAEASMLADLGYDATPVTALKGLTGYLGAATAIAELCIGILAARRGSAPPVARLAAPDDGCRLDLVVGQPRALGAGATSLLALSRSWSGQCAAISVVCES
jgi:3-oxoacyl-(acyl-carrier-protein) synthase